MVHWRRWRIALAAALVMCAAILPAAHARAAGMVAGTWQGQLVLYAYPCAGGTACAGTFSGTVAGSAAGTDAGGQPYTVTFPDPTNPGPTVNLSASFDYSEQCPLSATGTASGSFTLSGGLVDDGGVISHDGTLSGNFGWLRVGLSVVVETSGGVLTGGGTTLATQQTIGAGTGAFAPVAVPTTCSTVQSISAAIGGSYTSE